MCDVHLPLATGTKQHLHDSWASGFGTLFFCAGWGGTKGRSGDVLASPTGVATGNLNSAKHLPSNMKSRL